MNKEQDELKCECEIIIQETVFCESIDKLRSDAQENHVVDSDRLSKKKKMHTKNKRRVNANKNNLRKSLSIWWETDIADINVMTGCEVTVKY